MHHLKLDLQINNYMHIAACYKQSLSSNPAPYGKNLGKVKSNEDMFKNLWSFPAETVGRINISLCLSLFTMKQISQIENLMTLIWNVILALVLIFHVWSHTNLSNLYVANI